MPTVDVTSPISLARACPRAGSRTSPKRCGATRVSSGTVSKLNQKVYKHIETWRNRLIEGEHPYVYLDGVVLKRSWAGKVRNVSVLVAIGVGADGYRRILGVAEGLKEDKAGWSGFLRHLKERGLQGVQLVISDAGLGLKESGVRLLR